MLSGALILVLVVITRVANALGALYVPGIHWGLLQPFLVTVQDSSSFYSYVINEEIETYRS